MSENASEGQTTTHENTPTIYAVHVRHARLSRVVPCLSEHGGGIIRMRGLQRPNVSGEGDQMQQNAPTFFRKKNKREKS